ncbi:MAG: TOBE domain-containing protein [Actinomycetota bacterium]|nr:TOBE domain-containing protein [Actinomycetota bacterium]
MNLWPLGAGDNATHQEGLRLPDKIASLSARAGRLGATVGIRPEHLHIAGTRSDLVAHFTCRVQVVENLGSHLLLHGAMIDQARADVVAKLEPQFDVGRGDTISFGARAEHVHVFDAESGARIDDAVHRGGTPLHSHYRRQREAVIG